MPFSTLSETTPFPSSKTPTLPSPIIAAPTTPSALLRVSRPSCVEVVVRIARRFPSCPTVTVPRPSLSAFSPTTAFPPLNTPTLPSPDMATPSAPPRALTAIRPSPDAPDRLTTGFPAASTMSRPRRRPRPCSRAVSFCSSAATRASRSPAPAPDVACALSRALPVAHEDREDQGGRHDGNVTSAAAKALNLLACTGKLACERVNARRGVRFDVLHRPLLSRARYTRGTRHGARGIRHLSPQRLCWMAAEYSRRRHDRQ